MCGYGVRLADGEPRVMICYESLGWFTMFTSNTVGPVGFKNLMESRVACIENSQAKRLALGASSCSEAGQPG